MEGGGTIDVDHQAAAFIADRHRRYAELRNGCPVVFNQQYGGFWMVTDYESVAAVARDNDTFAHKYEPDSDDGDLLPRHLWHPPPAVCASDGGVGDRRARARRTCAGCSTRT